MDTIDKNVYFDMRWEDSENAGIVSAECKKCGYKEDYSDDELCVGTGDTWLCRNCGYEVEFVWHGMWWKQSYAQDNKMHKNIDECIKDEVKDKIEEKFKEVIKAPMHHIHKLEKELEHKKKLQS